MALTSPPTLDDATSSQNPSPVDDDAVKAFTSLDDAGQDALLKKMSPDAQQALLTSLKSRSKKVVPNPDAVVAPEETGTGATYTKLGRGLALGAAEGAGIPEASTGKEVLTGALKNAGEGIYNLGKAGLQDIGQVGHAAYADVVPGAEPAPLGDSHLFGILDNMATNVEKSGSEAWKGLKDADPELFAHGIGSLITQFAMMKESGKGKAGAIDKAKATSKIAAAVDIGKDGVESLEKSMPDIIDQAQRRGVNTIGDLRAAVETASRGVNDEFDAGLKPIAKKQVLPVDIAHKILSTITPDMMKEYNVIETAKQRAQQAGMTNVRFKFSDAAWNAHDAVVETQRRARDFQRTWTLNELNELRKTENAKLTTFYDKSSQGQNAALGKVGTDISKAVRDGASQIVYREWDKANPASAEAQNIKSRQGALWAMSDLLYEKANDLRAKQLKHEGQGLFGRIKANTIIRPSGVHGYLGGLTEAFSKGAEETANDQVKSAFQPSLTDRASKLGVSMLPIGLLARDKSKDRNVTTPPPKLQ